MRAAVVLGLLVAGCDPGPAFVDIRITAPDDVVRVELFMAPHACADDTRVVAGTCAENPTQLAWDTAARKMDGDAFVLDINGVTLADRLEDGTFRIDIKREENGRNKLERLLFVGYPDAEGTMQPTAAAMLKHVELPLNTSERWNVEIERTTPLPPTDVPTPMDDQQRIRFWNRRGADALERCIVMERWHSGEVHRDFLVPHDDIDCDGLTRLTECDPLWWNQPTPAPGGIPNCVTKKTLPNRPFGSPVTCQLGATVCSETDVSLPGEGVCEPLAPSYCLASSLCEPTCFADLPLCFETKLAHIHCDIPTDEQGAPCTSNDVGFVSLSELGASPLADCGLPVFGPLPNPFPPFPTLNNPGMVGFIQLTATDSANMSNTCSADLRWTGVATGSSEEYGLAKIPLPNGTSAVVGVLLDVHYNACASMFMSCYPVFPADDSATHCGKLP